MYLLYNIGYGGWATHSSLYTWQVTSRNLFDTPKVIRLYSNGDVLSFTLKRDMHQMTSREFDHLEVGPLNSEDSLELSDFESELILAEARIVGLDGDLLWSSAASWSTSAGFRICPYIRGAYKPARTAAPTPKPPTTTLPPASPATSCDSGGGTTSKCATNTCGWVLPEFRYNCCIFADMQLNNANTGQGLIVPGICTNVNKFLTARALSSNGLALTSPCRT